MILRKMFRETFRNAPKSAELLFRYSTDAGESVPLQRRKDGRGPGSPSPGPSPVREGGAGGGGRKGGRKEIRAAAIFDLLGNGAGREWARPRKEGEEPSRRKRGGGGRGALAGNREAPRLQRRRGEEGEGAGVRVCRRACVQACVCAGVRTLIYLKRTGTGNKKEKSINLKRKKAT